MIRKANVKDIPAILGLLKQVLAVHAVGRPDIFKAVGYKYDAGELEKLFTDRDRIILVYTDDAGEVLAHCFCIVQTQEETPAVYPFRTLYIDDICVREDARGRHIGTELYCFVRDYAKEQGFHNVTLHVWEKNPSAMEFYRSLGMQVQQTTMEEIL